MPKRSEDEVEAILESHEPARYRDKLIADQVIREKLETTRKVMQMALADLDELIPPN